MPDDLSTRAEARNATRAGRRPFREPAVLLLMALFILHGAVYAITDPVWQAPDEPQHVATMRYIHQHLTYPDARTALVQPEIVGSLLPSHFYDLQEASADWWRGAVIAPWRSLNEIDGSSPGGLISVDGHPPAYYYVMAPVEAAASRLSFPAEVLVLRLVTLLMAAPAILFGYAAIRLLWPSRPTLAIVAVGLVALLPEFAHISASVSNDPPLVTLFTAALYLAARTLKSGMTVGTAVWVALVGAVAALTKEHGVLAIAVLGIAVGTAGLTRKVSWRIAAPAIAVPVLAAAGWYGGRMALGLPITPTDPFPRPPSPHPESLYFYVHTYALRQFLASFWGRFGWLSVRLPRWLDKTLEGAMIGLSIVSIVVGLVAAARRRASRAQIVLGTTAVACVGLIGVLVLYLSWRGFVRDGMARGLQGRYLFPLVVAIAVMMVGGILVLAGARLRPVLAAGIIAAMIVLSVASVSKVLRAFYGPHHTGTGTLLAHLSRFSPLSVAAPLVLAIGGAAIVLATGVAVLAARTTDGDPAPMQAAPVFAHEGAA